MMDNKKYISRKIHSKKTVKEIDKKIKLLGVSAKFDVYTFLDMRLFGSIIIFFLVLFISDFGYLLAPFLTLVYCSVTAVISYIAPTYCDSSCLDNSQSFLETAIMVC